MDPQPHSSSLSLELRIIRARNISLKSAGEFFIRCYLSAGSNKRVRIDSQEISSDLNWVQTFSLDCSGTQDSIEWLKQGTIVLELRRRSWMNGSKLVATAEMQWKDVVDSPNMEIEKWVVMVPENGRLCDGGKPPAVQIAMKIEESAEVIKRSNGGRRYCEECCCMESGCNSFVDYEFFAIGAAFEAF